jgi:2-phospho-L-lactate transferase/gluconeogenesis factor (CofD/UPF0052 family)
MKLKQIKPTPIICEGRVDPNIMMSIQNVIKDGQITDTFQAVMMVRILEMLKYGDFYNQQNFWEVTMPTQKELLDHVRGLEPAMQVKLAEKFLNALIMKDEDLLFKYVNTTQGLDEWIAEYTAREAND